MSNLKQNGKLRWTPSYLRRQGQMTPAQKRAFRESWPTYGLEFRYGEEVDLDAAFSGQNGPLFLEIGFGMGENLVFQAGMHAESRILGIEVHKPGIGAALMKIIDEGVENVRLMRGDARLILSDYLPETACFDRISILFPDPWPDEENAHRRIVQPDLIDLFERRMNPGGEFHFASDVDIYRDHTEAVMSARENWEKVEVFELRQYRCKTRYEEKGISEGRGIYDRVFRYQG